MDTRRIRHVCLVALQVSILAVPACAAPVAKVQAERPPADAPAPKAESPAGLAQFYGFGEMEILKLQWQLGDAIVSDVNGDGLNDLVAVNNRKARIELLLQKKDFDPTRTVPVEIEDEDVNDVFGREATWRFARAPYDLDVAATALVVADLNDDKRPDLAFNGKDGLYVTLQQAPKKPQPAGKTAGPREPVWQPAKRFDTPGSQQTENALAAGDLNGDGRNDLALLAANGTYILLQKPDGSLDQPVKHYSSAEKITNLFVTDIDSDGRDDLVLHVGDRKFPLRVRHQTPAGKLGPEVRLRMAAASELDVARLGRRNCLVAVSAHSGRLQIWTQAPEASQERYPVFTYPLPATKSAENRGVIDADVDGDGLRDVVVSDPDRGEFLLYRAKAGSSLGEPQAFPGPTDMRKLAAGDLDGGGKDAVVALSVKEKLIAVTRLEKGRLVYPKSIPIKGEPLAMDLADVDGEGRLDLLYVAKPKGGKYWLRTVLNVGRDDAKAGPELQLTQLKDKPLDLRSADIDHDGRVDVMIVRAYGPLLLVRQGQAGKFEQTFGADIHEGLVANVTPRILSVADLAPGQKPAILLAKKKFARALVFETGKGWQVFDQYQAPSPQSNLTAAAAAVLPGREDMTILAYDAARSKLVLLARKPDGTYRTEKELEVGSISVRRILTGNFGGESPMSLLLAGTNRLLRVPLAGRTYQLRRIASFESKIKDGRYGALAVGDVNGDGLPDLCICEQARKHVEILTFTAQGRIVSAAKFKVFEQPRGVERSAYGMQKKAGRQPRNVLIGDVTNDGKADLILQVHDRIIIYPQD